MNGEPARRPGGGVRLLLLLAAAGGFLEVFAVGFPPAARDRLPILLLALALALLSAWNPERGLVLFSFLFPLSGVGNRLFGGADAIAWPVLLFAGFAAGWTFRFLYDFESRPEPSRLDPTLRALAAVWALATLLAVVRARTLWAFVHGLRLRAVNVEGLLDAAAIRDSVLSFAVLAAGVGYFFILRRAGPSARERALSAALWGVGVSAAAAIAERLGMPPGETSEFWRMTGRLSGGAVDPNALGLLCALAAVAAVGRLWTDSRRRAGAALLGVLFAAGLILSGSRSGLALAVFGLLALLLMRGLPGRLRLALAGTLVVVLLAAGALLLRGVSGSLGARLHEALDPALSLEYRASARPLLWASAVRLFERQPLAGAGLGAFSWQLPDLLAEAGRSLPNRDNPGNAYLQALAETGAIGALLTLAFAAALAREAWSASRRPEATPLRAGCGAAVLGFLLVLLAGSHWFAPDVALLFFLLAAATARSATEPAGRSTRWARRLLVASYAAAAVWSTLATRTPEEAFRNRQGIGFHAKETGPGGPFFWTQRRFAIRLSPGETMRLSLALYTPEGRSVELTAENDGRTALRRRLEPGQAVTLRLSGARQSARVIRFSLTRAFVPKRLGLSADRRELGVIAVFPPSRP